MIKKIVLKILKGLLLFIGVIALYLLSTFILSKITVKAEPSTPNEVEVYILTNGVHTDIVVPTKTEYLNWLEKIDFLDDSLDPSIYQYLAIGWGDKGFYLNTPSWSDLKLSTALKAIVGIGGSAIHATYYTNMTENENCKKLQLSAEQYKRLVAFIQQSLQSDEARNFIKIKTEANNGKTDAFYEATGRYNLYNTCNSWANRGLKISGQKACLWTAFQQPIFDKY